MKTLCELADPNTTDKNSLHSYLPVYDLKLQTRRDAKKVLEIGVQRGGSIKMWSEYFPNAEVWGFDIMPKHTVPDFLKNNPKIKVFPEVNAYDTRLISELVQKGYYFDMICDDGDHTLQSMCFVAKYYSQLLAPGGLLIIEDIPSLDWLDAIYASVPAHFKGYCEAYDLRENKGRHDDILFFINHKPAERLPASVKGNRVELRK